MIDDSVAIRPTSHLSKTYVRFHVRVIFQNVPWFPLCFCFISHFVFPCYNSKDLQMFYITLQRIERKCLPLLLFGLEVCPLAKTDLRSLDFVVNRFFVKLFKTTDINVVEIAK